MKSIVVLLAAISIALPTAVSNAQAGGSPSFQPPSVTSRELNFGITHFRGGVASLLFQWREGITNRLQFSIDAGLADGEARNSDNQLFVGGALGYELATETPDVPLDFLLTTGLYVGAGNYSVVRVPVGVSVGHTFPLDGNLSLTPYVHPRVAVESCKGCSTFGVDFDIGGSLKLSNILALRVSGVFGTSDAAGHDGFGISLAWTPPGLKK